MEKVRTVEKTLPDEWPNAMRSREELDAALEAGLASGSSDRTWDEVIEEARAKLDLG